MNLEHICSSETFPTSQCLSEIQQYKSKTSQIEDEDQHGSEENQYSMQFDDGYIDYYDNSSCHHESLAYSDERGDMIEEKAEILQEQPDEKYYKTINQEQADNQEQIRLTYALTTIQATHKGLILQLEKFSTTEFPIIDPSTHPTLIPLRSYLSTASRLLSGLFKQWQSVNNIVEKLSAKDQKQIIEEVVFNSTRWLIWMETKFEEWDLDYTRFYILFKQIYPKLSWSSRVCMIMHEWKSLFMRKIMVTRTLCMKVIQQQKVIQSQKVIQQQNHSDSAQDLSIQLDNVFQTYFIAKIQPTLNSKIQPKIITKIQPNESFLMGQNNQQLTVQKQQQIARRFWQQNVLKYLEMIVDQKQLYSKLSDRYLKQIHASVFTLSKDQLYQLVVNFIEAQSSYLTLEHMYGSYFAKLHNKENPLLNKLTLVLQENPLLNKLTLTLCMDKLTNQVNSNIQNWFQNHLLDLLNLPIQTSQLPIQTSQLPIQTSQLFIQTSQLFIQTPQQGNCHISSNYIGFIQDFLKFWSDQKQCQICLTTYLSFKMIKAFHCNHDFCHHCLTQHLNHQLNSFTLIHCPIEQCRQSINKSSQFYQFMTYEDLKKQKHIENYKFVQNDSLFKLCPTSQCSGIIAFINGEPIPCNICSNIFCEKCFNIAHEGDCELNSVYFLKKNYSLARCQKCRFLIEKSDGCNHITCRCGYEFCYICGQKWHPDNSKCKLRKEATYYETDERYQMAGRAQRYRERGAQRVSEGERHQQRQREMQQQKEIFQTDNNMWRDNGSSMKQEGEDLQLVLQMSQISYYEDVQEKSKWQQQENILLQQQENMVKEISEKQTQQQPNLQNGEHNYDYWTME